MRRKKLSWTRKAAIDARGAARHAGRAAVDSELDPGDLVAHHGLVVHGSAPNLSDALRTTCIIQYAAADALAYTAPVIDSVHRNRMVRGEPPRFARVEAGTIELPPDFSAGYGGIYSLQQPVRAAGG